MCLSLAQPQLAIKRCQHVSRETLRLKENLLFDFLQKQHFKALGYRELDQGRRSETDGVGAVV